MENRTMKVSQLPVTVFFSIINKLFTALTAGSLATILLLGTTAASAQTVITDPNNPDTVIRIENLSVVVNDRTVIYNDADNRNKVQGKRVGDGQNLTNVSMMSDLWDIRRITTTGDLSGNLVEEVGALGEKSTDGTISIQLKDYADKTVTKNISP